MKVSYWISAFLIGCFVGIPTARCEQVVFTEIMYHPPGTLPEYIEVYNNTATPFDMAEWVLDDGVHYVFPAFSATDPTRTFLMPFERIMLSGVDEASLRAAYNVASTVRVYGPWTGSLNNAGERITLKDKNGVVVCTVQYNNRGRWSVAADGAGHSLLLRNPDKRIDDWRNWTVSRRRNGSPGTEEVLGAETSVANPEVNLSTGILFVDYNAVWRFNDQNVDLGTAWRAAAFDDSDWDLGTGLLGFETATLPGPGLSTPFENSNQLTYYLRSRFIYNGNLTGATITIDQILDDGAVYYLNGQEIGRSYMPSGAVTFTTAASQSHEAVEDLGVFKINGTALVQGTNVLAVEVHQVSPTSSDVVFGMRLSISAPSQSGLLINEVLPGPAGVGFVEIYNPGSSPVNLRDHYLSDDPANLRKARVATDVVVPAKGLASVGFAESGLAVTSPVRVYLVESDGTAAINAIHAAGMPLDGRSIGRKPTGSSSWYLFTEPTRDAANMSQSRLASTLELNEVHFGGSNQVDWAEFYNNSGETVSLEGLFLSANPDLADNVALHGSVPPGGFASQGLSFPLSGGEVTLFLVNGSNTVLSSGVFARPAMGDSLQAFPQGSNEWYASAVSTRDAANDPVRNTDIVINEIMYDSPSNERTGEFIELYNRGTAAVDLSGWRFVEGIDFTIPPGTSIPPDGYLVVAADAEWMLATYGEIPVIGDFQGQLSNQGELVRLVDVWGNLADEVDYLPGGTWPNLANGGGSSMELQNPWMDNGLASAWSDSDESYKTTYQHYSYSDVYRQLRADGQPTDYKELHLYLVGDSHVVLDNIQVRLNGTGSNLILNGNKMSTDGRSANGWLAQGTHYASFLEDTRLHILSDGHGDNRPNRVEIDVTAMQVNRTYEISFDARWFSGVPRLIVQTWDHSIATSIALPVPDDLGTPGAENSCFNPVTTPQSDDLHHEPAVPSAGQTVRVTAHVVSPTGSPKVSLYHRLDSTGSTAYSSKTMYDDGVSGGDEVAGDGVYSAQLTEYGKIGQVVQFHVLVRDNGEISQLPKAGADRPAMYVVDAPMAAGDLRRMRFLVSAADQAIIGGNTGGPYGYAFPKLSNHYFNMTLIVNEKDVYYGCEIRANGSPWLRGYSLDRGKFKLPKDNLFRGKSKLVYDTPPGENFHHDRLPRYWLYLLGHPVCENEFILIKVNAGGAMRREEIEPVGNDMLDRVYENGSQGELYRIDDEWWFTDSWSQTYMPADWCYKPRDYQRPYLVSSGTSYATTDNAGRYRTEWIKRTREDEDDFSSLISFFKTVTSDTYTQAEIERLIDPVATMKMFAVRGYIYDWDSFSMQRGKNGFFYRRPTDGRFMFFHWDSDLAFGSNGYFYQATGERNDVTAVKPYIDRWYNLRLFKHYIAVLTENYARNSARINAWLQAEENASSQYTVSSTYKNWFQSRESPANNFLGANRSITFALTTNSGNTIGTSEDTLTLSGVAPLRVFKVEAAGHPEAQFAWTNETAWTLTGILLHTGANDLTINAVSEFGAILEQDTITVNKTGNAPPVLSLKADPSWQVSSLDVLTMDVMDSCDPDGSMLTYTWSVTPSDAVLDASAQDMAIALFPRPGLYTFKVTGQDTGGGSATIQREAAVYAPGDFSSFDGPRLEPFWTQENLVLRPNYSTGPSYSLSEVPGQLVLQVWNTQAVPLSVTLPQYPFLWRTIPSLTDWAFLSSLDLRGQVFGDYMTGVMVGTIEGSSPVRYAFGIEDGKTLTVQRITASGSVSQPRSTGWNASQAELRVRRAANKLLFEQRIGEVWTAFHSATLPAGTEAVKAGPFIATDTPQSVRVAFDYATLVDPSASPEIQNLRISEIMYNPIGGGDYEFIELVNIGITPLHLTGIRFTAGIEYTFGDTLLDPNQYLVVAKNPVTFAGRYDVTRMNLAPGGFSGKLDNAGETIELSDPNGLAFLSMTYGTSGDWPSEADGSGPSLEVIDPAGNLNDPNNWRASPQPHGSPGN